MKKFSIMLLTFFIYPQLLLAQSKSPTSDCPTCDKAMQKLDEAIDELTIWTRDIINYIEKELSPSPPVKPPKAPVITDNTKPYYFFASSKNLGELQGLINCIQYTTCAKSTGLTIGGSEAEYRIHYKVKLSQYELQTIQASCPKSFLPANITLKDESATPAKPVNLSFNDTPELISNYTKKMQNLVLPELAIEDDMLFRARIRRLLKEENYQSAIDEVIKTLNLNKYNYKIKYDPSLKNAIAVTDHKLQTINISKMHLSTPSSIIQSIRHELEHVKQIEYASSQCIINNKYTDFSEHVLRERSAYMNDIMNTNNYCKGEAAFCNKLYKADSINQLSRY